MKPQTFVFDEQTAEDRMVQVNLLTQKAVEDGCDYRIRRSKVDGWYRAEVTVYPAGVAA